MTYHFLFSSIRSSQYFRSTQLQQRQQLRWQQSDYNLSKNNLQKKYMFGMYKLTATVVAQWVRTFARMRKFGYSNHKHKNKVMNNMHLLFCSCMPPLMEWQVRPHKLTCTDISGTVRNFSTVVEQEAYFWHQAKGTSPLNNGPSSITVSFLCYKFLYSLVYICSCSPQNLFKRKTWCCFSNELCSTFWLIVIIFWQNIKFPAYIFNHLWHTFNRKAIKVYSSYSLALLLRVE